MAQQRSSFPGHHSVTEDPPMDWQTDTGPSQEDINFKISPADAQILLKLGLQQEIKAHFNLDLDMKIDNNAGLQISIPNNHISITEYLLHFAKNFYNQVICQAFPLQYQVKNGGVLSQSAVRKGLVTAVDNTFICSYLDIGVEKREIKVFAVSEDVIQKTFQIIKDTLIELEIQINDHIKAALSQDATWCKFQDSLKSHSDNNAFTVAMVEQVIVITGLKKSVNTVYDHVKGIINELQIDQLPQPNERKTDYVKQEKLNSTEDSVEIEVDFPVSDHNVFSYIKTFHKTLNGVVLEAYEEKSKQGFTLKGLPAAVETAEKPLKDLVNQIIDKPITFQDEGYFSKDEGQQFLEDTVENDCKVLYEIYNKVSNRNGSVSRNQVRIMLSPKWSETDGHRLCTWKVEETCQVVLAESKVDEISAEVIVNIVDKKASGSTLQWQKKSSFQKVDLPVPKYFPSPQLDEINNSFRKLFQRLVDDKHGSVAVSIDNVCSYPVGGIVPRIIRSFASFLREKEHGEHLQLSLLICSTVTDKIKSAEVIIQNILDEEFGKKRTDEKASESYIDVQVVEGKLHETKADALVNTVSRKLDLSDGQVSRSLLHAAGRAMQEEIHSKYGKQFYIDDIAVTNGHKLNCQHVLHGVLYIVDENHVNSRQQYEENVIVFVTRCLNKAEELGCYSVAFPAIGTGRLQYPPEIVASSMFLAVTEYNDKHPDTALDEVMFVVYPADTEALQVFQSNEKDMIARKLEQNKSSTVTIQLVGSEENIDKAKQVIEDKLDWLKNKVKIHGVSNVSYKLLQFFHPDVIAKYEEKGCQFNCEDEVLTIQADSKDIKTVETEINHCLVVNKQLSVEELTADGIDIDAVEDMLNGRNKDGVCYILDREKHEVLLYGTFIDIVQRQKAQLNVLLTMARKKLNSQKGMSKTMKGTVACKTAGVSKADDEKALESIRGTKIDGESKVKDTGRSKPAVHEVKIENVPFEYYMLMKKMNDTFFHKCAVSYDSDHKQVCLDMRNKKEFDKLLSEVKKLQTQDVVVHKTQKDCESFNDTDYDSDNVVCIYSTDTSTISVYGHEMKLVQAKVHQIKVDLGLVGKSERGARQLTESFQFSDSPDSDDKKSHGIDYHSRGARPKDRTGQAQSVSYALPNQETFLTDENIPVTVYTKNILHLHVDCIVNAANENLKHGGGIAEVISKAAGNELDKDCSDFIKRKGKLQTGEVYVSKPGKLRYKYVIHAVGPRWGDYKPHKPDDINRCKRDLFMAVLNSFLAAEEKGMETIAVPAISSAVFKVPKYICTEMYAAAVLVYSKQASSASRLREIHFIDSQPDIIRLIQGTFRKMIPNGPIPEYLQKKRSGTRKQVPAPTPPIDTSKSDQRTKQHDKKTSLVYPFPYTEERASDGGFRKELHCNFSRMLQLIVSTGNIFEKDKTADAVVCSEDRNGHGPGYITKKLLEKCKTKYKSAKETAFKKMPKYGDVVVCKGEDTGFKKVLHAVMWPKNSKYSEQEKQNKFRNMFKTVLRTAATERCQFIVMPLLFTGHGKIATDFCTEKLLEACMEFSKEEKQNKLTVYLVNSEPKKTATIEKVTADFISLQTALRVSSREHALPPVKYPSDHTDRHKRDQANIEMNRKPHFNRSQRDQKHHRNGAGVERLPYSVKQQSVDGKASKSQFYVDDSTARSSSEEEVEDFTAQEKEIEPDYDNDDIENDDNADKRGVSQDDNCVICMDTVNQPKKLKCGHVFCTDCIDNYFSNYKKVCPTCGAVCGVVKGDQPYGTIDVKFDKKFHCAGYEKAGSIIITYSFDSGTQGPDHPNPGKWFKGITRVGYLPDTKEGKEVLKMLEVAFKRKLVFTIGGSRTTGQEGVITWNDIHHKTNPNPNTPFGYPDTSYLDRVKDELAAKGVTPDDIPASYRCN